MTRKLRPFFFLAGTCLSSVGQKKGIITTSGPFCCPDSFDDPSSQEVSRREAVPKNYPNFSGQFV